MLSTNQLNTDQVLSGKGICGHLMLLSVRNFYIYISLFIIIVFIVLYFYYVIYAEPSYVFLFVVVGFLLSRFFMSDVFVLLKSVVHVECEMYIYEKVLLWLRYLKPYADNNIQTIAQNFTNGFISLFFLVLPAAITFVFQFIELKRNADYRVLMINLACIGMIGLFFRMKKKFLIKDNYATDILTSVSRYAFIMERGDTIEEARQVCLEYLDKEKSNDLHNKLVRVIAHGGMYVMFIMSIVISNVFLRYPRNSTQSNCIIVFYGALGVCVAEVVSMFEAFDNVEYAFKNLQKSIIIKKGRQTVNSIKELRLRIPVYYNTIAQIDEKYMDDLNGFNKSYEGGAHSPLLRDIDVTIGSDYAIVVSPNSRKYRISFYENTNIVMKGRSGEGKSTCMKFMCGCRFNPYSFVDGMQTQLIDDKSLGLIFRYFPQDDMLIDNISVADNFRIRGIDYDEALRITENLRIGFIIKNNWNDLVEKVSMSGGQRKRLNLAICGGLGLFNFFDESFSALSEEEQEAMNDMILSDGNRGVNVTIEHMGTMEKRANIVIKIINNTFEYWIYDFNNELILLNEPGTYRDCVVQEID
jgi:ABC-type multidrug transport system fused ATPase/permease subunit